MDIKQERVKFEATFQLSTHITFDEKKNAYVSSEYRYESKAHIANRMLEAWQAAISQLSNSDGYAVAGYVSKLPVTNPQSIRPDANDAFQVPVYTAAPTPDGDRLEDRIEEMKNKDWAQQCSDQAIANKEDK